MAMNLDEAQQLVEKALELSPKSGDIIDSLGWVFYQKRMYPEAEAELRRAIDIKGPDAIILEHLADSLQAQGRTEEAIEKWQESLLLDSTEKDRKRIRLKLEKAISERRP